MYLFHLINFHNKKKEKYGISKSTIMAISLTIFYMDFEMV